MALLGRAARAANTTIPIVLPFIHEHLEVAKAKAKAKCLISVDQE
jgi:hypothetical protein